LLSRGGRRTTMYVTLKRGDKLPTVALAQARLVEAGANALAIDGIFGPQTEQAVLVFQNTVGIPATGQVEQPTWAAFSVSRPIKVIDAVDATDIAVLRADEPYLRDGHSRVEVTYGMSGGARSLVHRLVSSTAPGSVSLLRLHGHGHAGHMGVSVGNEPAVDYSGPRPVSYGSGMFGAGQFKNPVAVATYRQLGAIMAASGSIELHGCNVAMHRLGRDLLSALARTCRVPVTAAFQLQYGEDGASRLEGPTLTCFPDGEGLRSWARRAFTECSA
jgi:hypothetical protein